jgi:hypothetical protein
MFGAGAARQGLAVRTKHLLFFDGQLLEARLQQLIDSFYLLAKTFVQIYSEREESRALTPLLAQSLFRHVPGDTKAIASHISHGRTLTDSATRPIHHLVGGAPRVGNTFHVEKIDEFRVQGDVTTARLLIVRGKRTKKSCKSPAARGLGYV